LDNQITKTIKFFLKIRRLTSFGYLDIQHYPRLDNVGYPNSQNHQNFLTNLPLAKFWLFGYPSLSSFG
jgi:hypothetical protein